MFLEWLLVTPQIISDKTMIFQNAFARYEYKQ